MLYTVHHGNHRDNKGNKKTLAVRAITFLEIKEKCKFHYGFGGQNKNAIYVDVLDWNKCLSIINEHVERGWDLFVKKETSITIK